MLIEFLIMLQKCSDAYAKGQKIIRYEEINGLRFGSTCAVVDIFSVAVAREKVTPNFASCMCTVAVGSTGLYRLVYEASQLDNILVN